MNLQIWPRLGLSTIVILSLHLNVGGVRTHVFAQDALNSYEVISHKTHERVLDIVFEQDRVKWDYDLVLRFEPTFAPESQIVIKRRVDKTEVVEYTSVSGNIYRKLNSWKANGRMEDAVEMAKLIQVMKRLIEIPNDEIDWRRGLVESIGPSMKVLEERRLQYEKGVGAIALDGTFYSLWYNQVGSHLSFTLLDHEISDR